MTISKGKKRVMVTLEIELVELLQKNAETENRSLSNYIETILINFVQYDKKGD